MIAYIWRMYFYFLFTVVIVKQSRKWTAVLRGTGLDSLDSSIYDWKSQKKSSHQYQRHSASSSFVVAMSRRFDAQSIRRNKLVNRDRFETSSFASFFILCGGRLACYRKYITLQSKIHHGQPLNLSFPNLSKLMLCCWMIFIHTIHNVTHQQNRDFASRTTAYYNIFVSSKSKNTDHVRSLM